MTRYSLKFVLESDATFGRGDGVAGFVDTEVQHDDYGCPYLSGKTLKGLLVQECAEILAALPEDDRVRWEKAAAGLFGSPGAVLGRESILSVSDARLPSDLRALLIEDVIKKRATSEAILESLTAIRRQTAIGEDGTARDHTLRTMRVVLRQTPFVAELSFSREPSVDELTLLAACVKAFRRAGTGRTRGRGRLRADLLDGTGRAVTAHFFDLFRKAVCP